MISRHPGSYRSTLLACYIGNIVMAIVINLTPVLFIPLREQYGFSFGQLGFLVFVNFTTQVSCDLIFSKAVDNHGFRPFIVAAQALTIIGFILFILSPLVLENPYPGFIVATIVFSGAGGLMELLLSPIVNAIPTDTQSTAMSLLHSFYAWGQAGVVLLTTVLLFIFGASNWPFIIAFWLILPVISLILFCRVPLAPIKPAAELMRMRDFVCKPAFILSFLAILFGGAAEVAISQWSSAYMEKAVGLPKIVGDAAGMALFAIMMGVGRLLYGTAGGKVKLSRIMIMGSVLAVICYLVVALSPVPAFGLIACALSGLAVSLLWPGTLVMAAAHFPLAGASLFAVLAAGGDIGASTGPWLSGLITEYAPHWDFLAGALRQTGLNVEQFGLRAGMLFATIFPIGSLICQIWLRRNNITTKES
ncbi:MAG: MFS transporter [Clostridiaceae bacterium]|nr:MFS transporter [Clostridiaceae bacterium]